MNGMFKRLAVAGLAVAAACAPALADYPATSKTSTALNTWTSNIEGVLKAAKTTGCPILIVGVNGHPGDSCVHCERLFKYTINTPEFQNTIKDTKFYMVLINFDPQGQGYRSDAWDIYTRYDGPYTYPLCSVLDSGGNIYAALNYTQTDYAKIGSMSTAEYLRQKLRALSRSITRLSFSAASAAATAGGAYSGAVVRSGGAGTAGRVALALTGANAAKYELSPASIDFGTADGSRSFTVRGPSDAAGRLVADDVAVTLSASGYDGSVEYGTRTLAISFKDARIKSTLAEFKAANESFASLSGSGAVWYVPADGGAVLVSSEVPAGSEAALTWTAPSAGALKVAARSSGTVAVKSSVRADVKAVSSAASSIDVASGEVLTITCAPAAGSGPETFAITELSFSATSPVFASGSSTRTLYTRAGASVSVAASGAGPIEYSSTKLPAGLKLDKATGVISGTPAQTATKTVTVTARNAAGSAQTKVTFVVKNFNDAGVKGKYSGIVFDARENVLGTVEFSVSGSASGKAKFALAGGKASEKVSVVFDGAGAASLASVSGGALSVVRTGGLWAGTWSGRKVLAAAKAGCAAGYYTGGLTKGGAGCGYVTVTAKANGKVSAKGRVDGALRYSASGQALSLSAAQVAAHLPSWSRGSGATFFPAAKSVSGRQVAVGGAMYADGALSVRALVDGSPREGSGAKFAQPADLSGLAGAKLVASGGAVSVPVDVRSATKIAAGANDFGAKLSANKKTGVFSGSYRRDGATRTFEGVLVRGASGLSGVGATKTGALESVYIE